VALISCAQAPEDFARELQAEWQRAAASPTPEVLSRLTPASRDLAEGLDRQGRWPALREQMLVAFVDATMQKAGDGSLNRILQRPGGPALLLVRDGWGWRLDLVLSDGVWPLGGPGEDYSRPW